MMYDLKNTRTCNLIERLLEATSLAHQPPAGIELLLSFSTGMAIEVPLLGLGCLVSTFNIK